MSFIGRAAVWTHMNDAGKDGNRSHRRPASTAHLTPLEIMTGSRIAASGHGGMGFTVGGQTWDESPRRRPGRPLPTDQPRSPYQHLFDVISRRTNRAPDSRACPRCGQPPHNDWGHEYERLVCQEITAA
jgi:hypothetical protein